MEHNKKRDKESHKGIYIFSVIIVILLGLFSLTFTHPVMLLAPFWDSDIEQHLTRANQNAFETAFEMDFPLDETMVYYRLIYDNNSDTDVRIQRAIMVYERMFDHPDNFYEIKYEDNQTLLEFTWHYQKIN